MIDHRLTRRLRAAVALAASITLAACAHAPATSEPPALQLADAERFARLMGPGSPPTATELQAAYLAPASEGVAIFTPNRIVSAENLAAAVRAIPADYRKAIELCLPVARQMQGETSRLMARVGRELGQAQPAPAYAVIGAGNSGGTADARGLVLGLEVICQTADSAEAARQILRDFVAHEMTHVYQARANVAERETDLLHQSLVEGFADLVMERALDGTPPLTGAERSRHGLANEAALWREFKADVDAGRTDTEWLYRQKMSKPGRPPDMGYWIGKRICEAYLAQAADKPAAMRTLLELRDARAILAASGYAQRFAGAARP